MQILYRVCHDADHTSHGAPLGLRRAGVASKGMRRPETHVRRTAKRRRTIAVVLCAGQGTRMGALQNKVFLPLAGRPVVVYSLEALQRARSVGGILLVAHPSELSYCRTEIVARYKIRRVLAVISGGATRHQSEERALDFLRPQIEGEEGSRIDVVVFHDGARPFVTPDEIDRLVGVARERGGALLGTRLEKWETIAQLRDDGSLGGILPSDELWRAQTPQAFEARALLVAYDQARIAGFQGTDTASTYERLGYPVHMVEGSRDNIKMTTPRDLLRALTLLGNR